MIKLKADPTFVANVDIPSPNGGMAIKFTFNHMRKSDLEAFLTGEDAKGRSDEDVVLAIASGWSGVDAEFNRDSLTQLFQNYHGAPRAIVTKWFDQLTGR